MARRRSDVDAQTWHGEDPSLAALIPEAHRRAVEDLHLHAHVRAAMLSQKLWTAQELREYLDISERTWQRVKLDAGLQALCVRLEGMPERWPAGAVVSYVLRRGRSGKDER